MQTQGEKTARDKNIFWPLAGKLILDPAYTWTKNNLMQQKRKQHRAWKYLKKHDGQNGDTSTGSAMNNSMVFKNKEKKKKHEKVLLKHKKANANQS